MPPRLLKRLANVYLIARDLYMNKHGAGLPPDDFIKWLALATRYPFESKALLAWLELKDWIDPKNVVFDKDGKFLLINKEDDAAKKPRPQVDSPFEGLEVRELDIFGQSLVKLNIDLGIVKATRSIHECFNLTLS